MTTPVAASRLSTGRDKSSPNILFRETPTYNGRRFIVESCARTPGHLASSLGAVELTVALHYVYDTPEDKIVWDVGHQAYAHKIITGRRDEFCTLRKMGGISGFPRPAESEYDAFTAGHASNSISAALGMAIANRLSDSRSHVVAVIGDGAMSGGLAFEGMNNAGVSRSDLLVILNDNRISIDKGTGALRDYLVSITTSERYNRFKTRVWNKFPPGSRVHNALKKTSNAIKHGLLQQSNLFESFGFRYFGPVDGHDVVSLVKVLRDLMRIGGPKLLHTMTVKGRGYAPAELDQSTWHAPGRFDPDTGRRDAETGERMDGVGTCNHSISRQGGADGAPTADFEAADSTDGTAAVAKQGGAAGASPSRERWQDVFGQTLIELARENPKIVAITPAMVSGSGLGEMAERMPGRVFDVGIAEGHAVTFAAGLAARGMVPFCVIYSSFLQRAWDNVIHDVALDDLGVVLCIDRAGLVGEDGATHHGVFDLAALLPVPGLVIASPMDGRELQKMMRLASRAGVPFVIRYPRGKVADAVAESVANVATDHGEGPAPEIEIGRGRRLSTPPSKGETSSGEFSPAAGDGGGRTGFIEARSGKSKANSAQLSPQTAVLSLGPVGHFAAEAVERAAAEGVSAAHYDLRFAKPLDEELLHEVGARFERVVTVEDGVVRGGVGSAVEDFFARHGYAIKVTKLGVPDQFIPHGTPAELYRLCGFDADGILAAILNIP